jgi:GNAT acetyltransferase-like protein
VTLSASWSAEGVAAAGVITVHGHDEIAAFDREIDALAVRCGAPVTSRWAWMWPTILQAGERSVATLVIGADGSLAAAAVIVHTTGDGERVVTPAAGGDAHRAPFLAVDDAAAAALARAVINTVARLDGPVRLQLGPTSLTDVTARRLQALLPGEVCAVSETIPMVRCGESTAVDDYLTEGMRRTLRKSGNRLRTDGRTARVEHARDREQIIEALPHVAEVTRRRDHAGGRTSPLDDIDGLRRWEGRILGLAALVDVELSTLFIDDEPAAYVVGVEDGGDYRVLEGRFVMDYARYSPGRLLEAAVLQRVLDSDRLDRLDWMTSIAPDRLLCANDGELVVRIDAAL